MYGQELFEKKIKMAEVNMNKTKVVNEKSVLADFEKLSKERKKEVVDFIA